MNCDTQRGDGSLQQAAASLGGCIYATWHTATAYVASCCLLRVSARDSSLTTCGRRCRVGRCGKVLQRDGLAAR